MHPIKRPAAVVCGVTAARTMLGTGWFGQRVGDGELETMYLVDPPIHGPSLDYSTPKSIVIECGAVQMVIRVAGSVN